MCGGRAVAVEPIQFTFWNVRNFSLAPAVSSTVKPKSGLSVAAVVEALVALRPDVVGMAEMGGVEDLAALQSKLKEAGLDFPHSEWVNGADPDRHLAVLSRFPIAARQSVTQQTYLMDKTRFPVQRGFLDVTLTVSPEYALRLVGAHLKSRLETVAGDETLMRRNEAHLLRLHVDGVLKSAPATNLLVFGDFNCTRDESASRAVRGLSQDETSLEEIRAVDAAGQRWTHHYPVADVYSCIDFLLRSKGLGAEVVVGSGSIYAATDFSVASDHRPVSVKIRPTER